MGLHRTIVSLTFSNLTASGTQVLARRYWYAGIGFIVNSKYNNYIKCYNCISDRVAFLDLEIPTKFGNPRRCRVINAY